MNKLILVLLLSFIGLMGCQKKDVDQPELKKEEVLTNSKWTADVSGAKQELVFDANQKFNFSTHIKFTAITPNLSIKVNLSGNWKSEGNNILISSPKIELYYNDKVVNNVQSILAGLSFNINEFIKQYNQYIEIDSNGNIKLTQSANKFTWVIDQLKNGTLIIVIGDKKIEFKKA